MAFGSFGAKIKVIGVGGGGGNAVNTMIRSNLDGVEFISANTDMQSLYSSLAPTKIQLGKDLTKGLGAGADPDIGRDAALEDRHELQEALADADMVFITAGMGGGTGTGGASVVAQIARELGALTVAVVTKPFNFEGKRRRKHSEMGISRLRESVDTLITIPNQRLLQIATPNMSMLEAFQLADNVLVNAVKGISDIINIPGLINVDFADVKAVMSSMGHALMGIGFGQGENRAVLAAKQAISSPLLEDVDIEGATGILINITAGSCVSILEINEACSIIQEAAHEDANIIFGAVIDESLGDAIRLTVIATGFPVEDAMSEPAMSSFNTTRPLTSPHRLSTPSRIIGNPVFSKQLTTSLAGNASRHKETFVMPKAPAEVKKAAPAADTFDTFAAPPAPVEAPITFADAAPPTFHDEAAELARLTFDEMSPSIPVALADDAPALSSIVEAPAGFMGLEDLVSPPLEAQEETPPVAATAAPRHGASATAPNPTQLLFDGTIDSLAADIDRKIDEAMHLADKLTSSSYS